MSYNNCTTDVLHEYEWSFDKYFAENKYGKWAMLVSDLSYMEGYITGLEKSVNCLREQLKREQNRNKRKIDD